MIMKLLPFAFFVTTLISMAACGNNDPEASNISATVEARVAIEVAIEATVEARVREELAKQISTATN